jgi:hypothetical protein
MAAQSREGTFRNDEGGLGMFKFEHLDAWKVSLEL